MANEERQGRLASVPFYEVSVSHCVGSVQYCVLSDGNKAKEMKAVLLDHSSVIANLDHGCRQRLLIDFLANWLRIMT